MLPGYLFKTTDTWPAHLHSPFSRPWWRRKWAWRWCCIRRQRPLPRRRPPSGTRRCPSCHPSEKEQGGQGLLFIFIYATSVKYEDYLPRQCGARSFCMGHTTLHESQPPRASIRRLKAGPWSRPCPSIREPWWRFKKDGDLRSRKMISLSGTRVRTSFWKWVSHCTMYGLRAGFSFHAFIWHSSALALGGFPQPPRDSTLKDSPGAVILSAVFNVQWNSLDTWPSKWKEWRMRWLDKNVHKYDDVYGTREKMTEWLGF